MEGDETESPTKRLSQESEDVLLKRLQDVVTERANHWPIMQIFPVSDEVASPKVCNIHRPITIQHDLYNQRATHRAAQGTEPVDHDGQSIVET